MEIESKMQVYEISYLFVPSIAEENVGAEVTRFKDMLSENEANFISDEYPKMIELSYQMSKNIANKKHRFTTGYFGWVKFEMPTENIAKVKSTLTNDDAFIRFLIIKTVKESTLAPKRAYSKDGARRKFQKTDQPTEEKVVEVIDEETIDKDIDALVVE
jgi:ribosomal protein S6